MSKEYRDVKHAWEVQNGLRGNSVTGTVRIGIEDARGGQGRRTRSRVAVVSVGKSSYYDPMEALRRAIHAHLDFQDSIQPVRHVKSAGATPMSEIQRGKSSIATFKQVIKRVPHGQIRMWRGPWTGKRCAGWFFMYPDKVLHVDCTRETGWKHTVVPEEGLALT